MRLADADLHHILNALESAESELTALQHDEQWFVSDSLELLESAKQCVLGSLQLDTQEEKEDEEYDGARNTSDLLFD